MPCCGEKRAQARQTTQTRRVSEATQKTSSQTRPERKTQVYFQYLGDTGLTVVARTGKSYRFDNPGAIVAADPRDLRSLVAVPTLRLVRQPT
jgi:hypothetical protein